MNEGPAREWGSWTAPALAISFVVAFVLRWVAAGRHLFGADEVMHWLDASEPTWSRVWSEALTQAHPPLFILVESAWATAGDSELWLRLPSVLAGTATVCLLALYARRAFGDRAAVAVALFAALNPMLVTLSAEVRQYALMQSGVAAAFLFQQRFLDEGSRRSLAVSVGCLSLAIASNYSALFACAALGAHALAHMAAARTTRRRLPLWMAAQAVPLALCAFFYLVHFSQLRGSEMERTAVDGWLRRVHYQPDEGSVGRFLYLRSWDLFAVQHGFREESNLWSQSGDWVVFGLAWTLALGFVVAAWRWRRSPAFWGAMAAALVAHASMAAAACLQRFPYGHTRHSSVLLLTSLPLFGLAVSELLRGHRKAGFAAVGVGVALAVFSPGFDAVIPGFGHRSIRRTERFRAEFLATVPREDFVFADRGSALVLSYYLRGDSPPVVSRRPDGAAEITSGGYRIRTSRASVFSFEGDAKEFLTALDEVRASDPSLRSAWIVSMAVPNLAEQLSRMQAVQVDSRRATSISLEFFRIRW